MIGYEYESIVNDLLERGIYKKNIGKWVAAVGDDYVIARSGKEALSEIRKRYGDIEPFICQILAPDKYVIIIAAA